MSIRSARAASPNEFEFTDGWGRSSKHAHPVRHPIGRLHLMSSTAKRIVGEATAKRLSGSRPGPIAALLAAIIVGVAAAAATYRLLRSGN
jgi:hypothetical protein